MRQRLIWLAVAAGLLLAGCAGIRYPDSYLPSGIRKVEIHYHPADQQPDRDLTVSRRSTIRALVETFNSLPPDPGGPRGCAMDYGQYAQVTFTTARGRRIGVYDWLPCLDLRVSTSRQHLFDQGGQFWRLVTKLLGARS